MAPGCDHPPASRRWVRCQLLGVTAGLTAAQEDAPAKPPAATEALMKSLADGLREEAVVPDIFRFQQTVWMHHSDKLYHPGNRRVVLRVAALDLRARYGLTERGLQHVLQVAGPRYNPRSGVLAISCDRHRAREDNRRQALHWLLQLIEGALLAHPSEEWEQAKARQAEFMEAMLPTAAERTAGVSS